MQFTNVSHLLPMTLPHVKQRTGMIMAPCYTVNTTAARRHVVADNTGSFSIYVVSKIYSALAEKEQRTCNVVRLSLTHKAHISSTKMSDKEAEVYSNAGGTGALKLKGGLEFKKKKKSKKDKKSKRKHDDDGEGDHYLAKRAEVSSRAAAEDDDGDENGETDPMVSWKACLRCL